MTKLFMPVTVGPIEVAHRVVLAPFTRMRTEAGDVPGDLMVEYYTQRATKGGLLITEATCVSPTGIAYAGAPGIITDAQVKGWKRVTDAVHAKGASIYLQLWHGGRQAHPANMGGELPIAPSAIRAEEKAVVRDGAGGFVEVDQVVPRALAVDEIPGVIEEFRQGAERAKAAGFDGVELHGANGYLPDQFLQDGSNQRNDAYGGPIENRARFMLEVVEALISVWGGDRVAVRISPSGRFGTMSDSNPAATFGYVAEKLNRFGLAYLHVIEPRIRGYEDLELNAPAVASRSLRGIFKGTIATPSMAAAQRAIPIIRSILRASLRVELANRDYVNPQGAKTASFSWSEPGSACLAGDHLPAGPISDQGLVLRIRNNLRCLTCDQVHKSLHLACENCGDKLESVLALEPEADRKNSGVPTTLRVVTKLPMPLLSI